MVGVEWQLDPQNLPGLLSVLEQNAPPLERWCVEVDVDVLSALIDVQHFSDTYNNPTSLALLQPVLIMLRSNLSDAMRRIDGASTDVTLTTQQLVYLLYWGRAMLENEQAPADMAKIGLDQAVVRPRLERLLRDGMMIGLLAAGWLRPVLSN